jgi:hypothetical protein
MELHQKLKSVVIVLAETVISLQCPELPCHFAKSIQYKINTDHSQENLAFLCSLRQLEKLHLQHVLIMQSNYHNLQVFVQHLDIWINIYI